MWNKLSFHISHQSGIKFKYIILIEKLFAKMIKNLIDCSELYKGINPKLIDLVLSIRFFI